jgi:hypothetical protein|tara:strand:- start:3447 stop:4136 length:690 start_codon:yes stop_codon:yes gene_type:complete
MDNLQSLMRCLDDISKVIPEGTYLEMCDNLKRVHDILPKNTDPPVRDNRGVPFQVVQPGLDVHRIINLPDDSDSDSESDSEVGDDDYNPEWYDEWTQNEECIRKRLIDMKLTKASLRTLKPIQRNTKRVREDAIQWYCHQINFLPAEITEWTFENLVTSIDWMETFTPDERKYYTSKKFERKLYDDYKMVENHRIDRLISDARDLKRNLECEISDYRDRQSYLRAHYNL